MLSCKNLSHTYKGGTTLHYPDWEVKQGQHALILGSSGCGKTSLLHLLSGLLPPSAGSVTIQGVDIGMLTTAKLDAFRGEHIGFVFQKPHLIGSLSVWENIALSPFLAKKSLDQNRMNVVLEELGIINLKDKSIHQISQGQAQRVAIARAVINQPSYIFCDEPTASLDDESCKSVVNLLKNQAELCKATLIIATHDQRVKDEFSNQLTL